MMPMILRAAPGGPLPRQVFRSFLATAGDPSPNRGGGVVTEGSRLDDGHRSASARGPHPRPLSRKLRGRGVTRPDVEERA